jgi:AAA family ATP:ADP antiporter
MRYSFLGTHVYNRREIIMLLLVSMQALFIGAFISLFSIGSHVLFLQSWTPERIPQAFIISGIVGIGLLSVYSYFANRTSFRAFTFWSLFILFITNLFLYIFYDDIAHFQLYGIPLMLPFILCIPFSFMVMVLFRRSVANILSPEQHRRFFPLMRTALIAGIIGSSYALVVALFIHWDILLITAGSAFFIGMASIMQLLVNYFHRVAGTFPQPIKHKAQLRSKFYEMFYTRYTFLLVAFVVVSAMVGFVIHYYFISGTRLNYPSTIGLAKFFGFFTGTMFLFIYILERFLVRKILYSYDSPYSLVLIPAVLVLASIATLIVDLLVGQSNVIARFSFGFLMIAMLKIGYETVYEAIELPSLRVLFRTLDLRFVNSIKPRLEGSFRMAALLLAGLSLFALLSFNLGRSLFLNLFILFLILVWLPIAILLVKSYQNALRDYIRRLKTSKRAIGQELLNSDEKSHSLINSPDHVKSVNALSIIERLEPLTHEKHLISLLETESADLRKYLLERIDENALLSSLPKLKELQQTEHPKQQNGYLPKLISRFEIKLMTGNSKNSVENIVDSSTLTDRILAAEIIGNSGNQNWGEYLLHLSRDFEPEVKLASVKAMARLGNLNHSYVLIGYLTTPAYYPYAFEALVKIGDPALPFMEQMFLLPEADNTLLSRIVRIYGKIGTPAAIEFLLAKIENQNRTISRQALLALREAKFQSTPGNINRILNDIVRLINIMSWNFAAYSSIRNSRHFRLLKDALNSEIKDNYNTLYHLLALAYNSTSIGNIKNMLLEGNDTDISFAIELLDQVVNEEIKQVFFPVVENISVKERFKLLQYFFQAIKETPEDLIQDIITRDFNQLSLYVKACAIQSILNLKKSEAGTEVIASIFHPNQLIRESAAYVLEQLEPGKLESVYLRLGQDKVNELKSTLSHVQNGIPYLLLDRIRFIKNCNHLQNVSEDVLLEISRALDLHQMKADEEFLVKREDVHFAFMIIIEGTAQINISSGKVFTFEKNDIIYSDIYVEDNTFSLRALTDIKFYSLEQEVLNSLMFDFIVFRDKILEIVEEA